MSPSRTLSLLPALALPLTLACGGSQPPEPVLQVVAPESTADALLMAVVDHELCDSLRGSFQALGGKEGEPSSGVLLVERCRSSREGDRVTLHASGRGWRWIDRERSKLGAEFEISQHVRFATSIQLSGHVDYAWAPDDRVLSIWLRTAGPLQVDFEVLGEVDVDEEGAWAEVLGAMADVAGGSPDQRAASTIEDQAAKRLDDAAEPGFTVAVDLCSRQVYTELSILPRGELPSVPMPPGDHRFQENAHVALHPGAPMLAGPFGRSSVPLRLRHEIEDGTAELGAYCMEDARQLVDATIAGEGHAPAPRAQHVVGGTGELSIDTSACPIALAWSLPEGTSEPVTARFLAHREGAEAEPLVDCRE